MADSIDILGLTSTMFIEQAAERGVSAARAMDLYRGLFRRGEREHAWMVLPDMPITRQQPDEAALKIVQSVGGSLETEAVILAYRSRAGRLRTTLCVSSQIGCAMGCTFCETAQMGLKRNLDAASIVGQWFAARFECDARIDNIVFMGMGEPMDDFDAVARAIRVFTDANGPAIAPSRITVSTVGRIAGIERLSELMSEPGLGRLRLAVSVNASNDTVRSGLMPVNRVDAMPDLMKAMLAWTERHRGRVLIEYVLIPGVNDGVEHARELAEYLDDLPCTINVIPYNPRRDSPWPAPGADDVDRFCTELRARGRLVTRRQTRGREVMAACGQLGNELIRKRQTARPDLACSPG